MTTTTTTTLNPGQAGITRALIAGLKLEDRTPHPAGVTPARPADAALPFLSLTYVPEAVAHAIAWVATGGTRGWDGDPLPRQFVAHLSAPRLVGSQAIGVTGHRGVRCTATMGGWRAEHFRCHGLITADSPNGRGPLCPLCPACLGLLRRAYNSRPAR